MWHSLHGSGFLPFHSGILRNTESFTWWRLRHCVNSFGKGMNVTDIHLYVSPTLTLCGASYPCWYEKYPLLALHGALKTVYLPVYFNKGHVSWMNRQCPGRHYLFLCSIIHYHATVIKVESVFTGQIRESCVGVDRCSVEASLSPTVFLYTQSISVQCEYCAQL